MRRYAMTRRTLLKTLTLLSATVPLLPPVLFAADGQTASEPNGTVTATGGSAQTELNSSGVKDISGVMRAKIGGAEYKNERVTMTVPDKVNDGDLVPLSILVDHPMEPDNYIELLAIFVDMNPNPFTAGVFFTPQSGRARLDINIRSGIYSNIRVVARTNTGLLYGTSKKIRAAYAGCGCGDSG